MKAKMLVVDDDKINRVLLSTNLQEAGFIVETAEGGQQALDKLGGNAYDVVLLDLMMPEVDGFQVLEYIKKDTTLRSVPVIVISAEEDREVVAMSIGMGATDHITKPFDPLLLHARINASLATKRLHEQEEAHRKEIEEYNRHLESRVKEQTKDLREIAESLRKALDGSVHALSWVVEFRDPYTAGHQKRVSQLATAMAKEMKLPSNVTEGIRVSGLLHDIGKICVPSEILSKPGVISELEFGIIATHPQVGYDILKTIEFPWPVARIVLQHHERIDGSGYPAHLKGDDILLEAKVISVADVVEAMSRHRPYRPSLGTNTALEEVSKKRGSHYDPVAVDACLTLFNQKSFEFDTTSAKI